MTNGLGDDCVQQFESKKIWKNILIIRRSVLTLQKNWMGTVELMIRDYKLQNTKLTFLVVLVACNIPSSCYLSLGLKLLLILLHIDICKTFFSYNACICVAIGCWLCTVLSTLYSRVNKTDWQGHLLSSSCPGQWTAKNNINILGMRFVVFAHARLKNVGRGHTP